MTSNQYDIPRSPEQIVDDNGRVTRPWYRWFSARVREGLNRIEEVNTGVTESIATNAEQIAATNEALNTNNATLGQVNADLESLKNTQADLASNIASLAEQLSALEEAHNNHVSATEVHGSDGNVLGANDIQGGEVIDSEAATVAGLKTDFNNLLVQLRAAGVIE